MYKRQAYNYASGDNGIGIYSGNGTPAAVSFAGLGVTNSFGLSAYWSPESASWFPSISTGWGINTTNIDNDSSTFADSATSQSWYVGLQWSDVFLKGNAAGMAVGQSTFITGVDFDSDYEGSEFIGDGNYAWEWWYMFQVTDNISVTPALFYLSRPLGQGTAGLGGGGLGPDGEPVGDNDNTFSNFGGLIKTTFKF
mgnify:FL=1